MLWICLYLVSICFPGKTINGIICKMHGFIMPAWKLPHLKSQFQPIGLKYSTLQNTLLQPCNLEQTQSLPASLSDFLHPISKPFTSLVMLSNKPKRLFLNLGLIQQVTLGSHSSDESRCKRDGKETRSEQLSSYRYQMIQLWKVLLD